MPCVYILQSLTTGKYYVGSTVNLERRLSEHGRHHSPYTRGRGLWRLVYHEPHANLEAARKREHEIKGGSRMRGSPTGLSVIARCRIDRAAGVTLA